MRNIPKSTKFDRNLEIYIKHKGEGITQEALSKEYGLSAPGISRVILSTKLRLEDIYMNPENYPDHLKQNVEQKLSEFGLQR